MRALFISLTLATLCLFNGFSVLGAETDPAPEEPPITVTPLPGFGLPPENPPSDSDVDDGTNPKGRENNPETEAPGIMTVPPVQGSSNTVTPPVTVQNNHRYTAALVPQQAEEPSGPATSVAGANTSQPINPITAVASTDPQELKPEPKLKPAILSFAALAILLAAATLLKLRRRK